MLSVNSQANSDNWQINLDLSPVIDAARVCYRRNVRTEAVLGEVVNAMEFLSKTTQQKVKWKFFSVCLFCQNSKAVFFNLFKGVVVALKP